MSSHAAAGTIDHHHDPSTSTGIPNKKLMMWTFLASDCMFFGALISTHLIYRLHPAPGSPSPKQIFSLELTSFSTFILLMSSLMMALAVTAIQKGNVKSMRWSLLTTIFFGAIFLGCQVYEFEEFVKLKNVTLTNSMFGTTFYTLVGFHAFHVIVGLVLLTGTFMLALCGCIKPERDTERVEIATWYWHFVDVVWIVVFTLVYFVGKVPQEALS